MRKGVVGICLLLAGLVSIQSPAPAFASEEGFYLQVPFVQQVENYCGPAALAMVLRYWDQETDQYELAGHFQPFPDRGLSGAQLKTLAETRGFAPYSFSGDPDFVRTQLRAGRPVIVALAPARFSSFNHYVVLVGWDAERRQWIVHDPADGPYGRHAADELEKRWAELDAWTLMVVPDAGE